jgi:hypothetical protein
LGPPGKNFGISQHCQHLFHHIEFDIQLHTKSPGPLICADELIEVLLICADELIEVLFISWADSCARPPRTWSVSYINVTTAKTHHPLPHCAHIHCLVNIQQEFGQFLLHRGIHWHTYASHALPCQMPFCQISPVLLSHSNKTYKLLVGSTSICL